FANLRSGPHGRVANAVPNSANAAVRSLSGNAGSKRRASGAGPSSQASLTVVAHDHLGIQLSQGGIKYLSAFIVGEMLDRVPDVAGCFLDDTWHVRVAGH